MTTSMIPELPKINQKTVHANKSVEDMKLSLKEKPSLVEPRLSKEDIDIINDVIDLKDLAEITYTMGEPPNTNYSNRCSADEKARITRVNKLALQLV